MNFDQRKGNRRVLFLFISVMLLSSSCRKNYAVKDFFEVKLLGISTISIDSVSFQGQIEEVDDLANMNLGFLVTRKEIPIDANIELLNDFDLIANIDDVILEGNIFSYEYLLTELSESIYVTAYANFEGRKVRSGSRLYNHVAVFNYSLDVDTTINNAAIIESIFLLKTNDSLDDHGLVLGMDSILDINEDTTIIFGPLNNDRLSRDTILNLNFNTKYFLRSYFLKDERVYYGKSVSFTIGGGWTKRNAIRSATRLDLVGGLIGSTNQFIFGLGCEDGCTSGQVAATNNQLWIGSFNDGQFDSIDIQALVALPFMGRRSPATFSFNGSFYLGLGYRNREGLNESYEVLNDFYRYSDEDQRFVALDEKYPVNIFDAVSFELNGIAYVGLGRQEINVPHNKFYSFHHNSTPQWQEAARSIRFENYNGSEVGSRFGAFSFNVKGTPFIGGGRVHLAKILLNDLYYLDEIEEGWKLFSVNSPWSAREDAVVFSDVNDERAFLGFGAGSNGQLGDVWSFDGESWQKFDQDFPYALGIEFNPYFGFAYEDRVIFGGFNPSDMKIEIWEYID